ncbi:type II toxin-antitoxin system PemK/MazF family toxin [Christensenella minuta]|uniref:type II toxin-antitoxin system PemK/MazF family toxin n=1 Tax=Christensenella minuta TaxID=626937 RepID=UPI0039B82FD6
MVKKFQVWDIWYAEYAYEDEPECSKDRPVLIINVNPLNLVMLKITSQGPRDSYDYTIKKWREAGLKEESHIRMLHRLSAKEEDFRRKIGSLHEVDRLCLKLKLSRL